MNHSRRRQSRQKQATGPAMEQAAHVYNEGVSLQEQGRTTLAEAAFRKALALNPEFPEAHNNLGNVLLEQEKWKVAEKSFRRALQLLPDNAMLLGNIGKAQHRQGKKAEALETLQQAILLDPHAAKAMYTLGTLLMEAGGSDEAIKQFEQARVLRPDSPEIANSLGAAFIKQERYEEAVAILHATVKAHPRFFDAYPNLAEAAFEIGAVDDAIKVLLEALKLAPENAAAHAQLAKVQHSQRNYLEARASITRAIRINPKNAAHYNLLARILYKMNLADEAATMAGKAISLNPDVAAYHHSLGVALMTSDNFEAAAHSFRRATRLQADYTHAHAMLAEVKQHLTHDEEMGTMETLLLKDDLSDQHAINLHFGLGKAFDDLGDYARAFKHFAQGNALTQASSTNEYDAGEYFRAVTATFNHNFLQQHLDTGMRGVTPVFIAGLPRSGKTVLECLLAHHPQITAGGESGEFQRLAGEIVGARTGKGFMDGIRELEAPAFAEIGRAYAESLQQRLSQIDYVTNTSPGITRYIGMIRQCLPDAKIILCMREARDLCTEIYKKNLDGEHHYSHDPLELGNYYQLHRNLMEHWRRLLPDFVHVVQFEELIRKPAQQINAILDFCSLPREEACLDTSSLPKPEAVIGVWEHYREPLKSMYEILDTR